jgi:hypothetical protein
MQVSQLRHYGTPDQSLTNIAPAATMTSFLAIAEYRVADLPDVAINSTPDAISGLLGPTQVILVTYHNGIQSRVFRYCIRYTRCSVSVIQFGRAFSTGVR